MQNTDIASVFAIEAQVQAHPWSQKQFESSLHSSHQCWVMEQEKSIVAYAVTSTAADEAELLTIAVSPQYQKQGLGRQFLEFLCGSFDQSLHSFFLEVRVSNHPAIALYQSFDFNEVGVRPDYYPKSDSHGREDALIMAKNL